MTQYNATSAGFDSEGNLVCVGTVQFSKGRVLRSNGLWTSANGSKEYHSQWLRSIPSFVAVTRVVVDGGDLFIAVLRDGFKKAQLPRFDAEFAK